MTPLSKREKHTLWRIDKMSIVICSDLSCEQAKLPYTILYKDSIGTTVENVHVYYGGISLLFPLLVDEKIWLMDMEAAYNGMNGIVVIFDVMV